MEWLDSRALYDILRDLMTQANEKRITEVEDFLSELKSQLHNK
ncbi:hypothetical protein N781_01790 [Pontibacillus halophilus JSM 076056 = DSM 19796]|uniref:Uncharacterized protein n=1 Tax=Pontibacillus halophilus JSM 076056 = DSM 19796 TaxID=1385510 RepID=A0A0A5GQ65_9BACI|nr:hypothetical protein [Pontibacillus halophilus]KGX94094.1 hypothetical protein N781_01790 [Pontibacillus halophilus JSM 076056 = DSM 19796]